jgi:pimeloyl-ACP methyl ester carboxylesterase
VVLIESGSDGTRGAGAGPGLAAPRIQYARAADGVGIACWTLGRGTPLVYLAGGPWSHVELWEIPECRRWYERLAQQRLLIRYDVRGTGLSERAVADYSLEALRGLTLGASGSGSTAGRTLPPWPC